MHHLYGVLESDHIYVYSAEKLECMHDIVHVVGSYI